MIHTAYIVHHSHTDIGYTDLPSTVWELQVQYIQSAIAFADQTRKYPADARFRWVCESAVVVEKFLEAATPGQRRRFGSLVKSGQFEVAAMPFNLQPLWDAAQWDAMMRRLRPLYAKFTPRTAMQNDINGFMWGMVPSLYAAGVRNAWLAINLYSGGTPLPQVPTGFWWQGPGEEKLLVWQGESYGNGYFYFHEHEWRRGPVPAEQDVFGHAPSARDIFGTSPQFLAGAAEQFRKRFEERQKNYPWSIMPLEITNMWRFDNDPPMRHLCDFVRAWNAAGNTPRLRFSTAGEFLRDFGALHGKQLPTLRGDWPDWWADGAASMPLEVSMNQRAKQVLSDTPRAARELGSKMNIGGRLDRAYRSAALFDEHTWGAYDSVASPYKPRALGALAQKTNHAYVAYDDAMRLRTDVLRASPSYRPSASTRFVRVFNPGTTPRSGWATISARLLRFEANALRDAETGEVLALETLLGHDWAVPVRDFGPAPFDVPDNVWRVMPQTLRAYVPGVGAGSSRRFELVQLDQPPIKAAKLKGSNDGLEWSFDRRTGAAISLVDRRKRRELVDTAAVYGFGQILIEQPTGPFPREVLATHDATQIAGILNRHSPRLDLFVGEAAFSGPRFRGVFSHPSFHRIEQVWKLLPEARISLTTTLWMKEYHGPQAIYLALPLATRRPRVFYYSLNQRTQVGVDQIPGVCGEFLAVNGGVEIETAAGALALAMPDAPLACFDEPHSRDGHKTAAPRSGHVYSMLHNTYWLTNFSHTRPTKVSFTHMIQAGATLAQLQDSLWIYPSA